MKVVRNEAERELFVSPPRVFCADSAIIEELYFYFAKKHRRFTRGGIGVQHSIQQQSAIAVIGAPFFCLYILPLYDVSTMMALVFAVHKFVYLKFYIGGLLRRICHTYSRQI